MVATDAVVEVVVVGVAAGAAVGAAAAGVYFAFTGSNVLSTSLSQKDKFWIKKTLILF